MQYHLYAGLYLDKGRLRLGRQYSHIKDAKEVKTFFIRIGILHVSWEESHENPNTKSQVELLTEGESL